MVTFFCSSCGEYLKKKQAEQHVGYCNDRLSCNDCKKVFAGYEAVRAHNQCGQPQADPKKGKGADIKKLKVDDIEINGLRTVIRKIVKRAEGRKINKDSLKRLVTEVYKHQKEELPDNFDELFKKKLASAKNLKVEGLLVKYERD